MNANHNLIAAYTYFVSHALGLGTEEVFFFFICVFLATTVATRANPHNSITVGTANRVTQACAFYPACASASSSTAHAPRRQPP